MQVDSTSADLAVVPATNTESHAAAAAPAAVTQESLEFPEGDDSGNLDSEMDAIAMSIGDAAADLNITQVAQGPDIFSHGATTWNRPIGPRMSGRTLASMRVGPPLNTYFCAGTSLAYFGKGNR